MSAPESAEDVKYVKPDGSKFSRVEMETQMRETWKKVFDMRLKARMKYDLRVVAFDMTEIEVRHWILDEMIRRGEIYGEVLGVNAQNYNDENEKRQFQMRLMALIQSGQAVMPKEGEGADEMNAPPPMPPGYPQPPQQNGAPPGPPGYAPPPPPVMGQPPGPPMGPPGNYGPPGGGYAPAPMPPNYGPPPGPPGPPQTQYGGPPPGPPGLPPGVQAGGYPAGPPGGYTQAPAPHGPPMAPPQQAAPPTPPAAPAAGGRGRKKAETAAVAPPVATGGFPLPTAQALFAPLPEQNAIVGHVTTDTRDVETAGAFRELKEIVLAQGEQIKLQNLALSLLVSIAYGKKQLDLTSLLKELGVLPQ